MWLLLLVAICRFDGPPCPVGQHPVVLRTYDSEDECLSAAASENLMMKEQMPYALAYSYCKHSDVPGDGN